MIYVFLLDLNYVKVEIYLVFKSIVQYIRLFLCVFQNQSNLIILNYLIKTKYCNFKINYTFLISKISLLRTCEI